MADDDEKMVVDTTDGSTSGPSEPAAVGDDVEVLDDDGQVVGELGTDKYVFAAFFAAGVCVAFLTGRILEAVWNTLAEWPAVVRAVPQLLRYAEDERPTFTMAAGVAFAITLVVVNTRKEGVRRWADDVAVELSKVHWPKKDAVTNGTVVVIAAGLFATIYIGLLDRLWGFVTMLVYGA
jgi:preprotein translocase subunit SecE